VKVVRKGRESGDRGRGEERKRGIEEGKKLG